MLTKIQNQTVNFAPQPVRERLFGVYHRGQNRYHDST